MLDLRRLRVLHEFSLRGTIAATAETLGYTASAVSQQLATLEREVGTPLVDRTARSAALTEAGSLLAGHAEQILAMVEAAESVIQEQTEVPTGQVTITAFPTAAVAFAPALAHSLSEHPGLQLQLRQTLEANGERLVTQGDADIALVDDWSGRRPDDQSGTLRIYHLFRDPLILIVPCDHPLADATQPVDLRRLRTARWLTTPRGEPSRAATDQILADIDAAPTATLEFEGLGTILSLVSRGIGIAAVPQLALSTEPSTVVHRAIVGRPPTRDIYAVVRATSVRRPSIAVTLRAIHSAASGIRRAALT